MADSDRQRPRKSHLRWVRLGDLQVHPRAQREFRRAHGDKLATSFDLEAMGFPVVNISSDGHHWIVDGQHRVYALLRNGFDDDDLIQVECYEGLSEAGMAELFLQRDDRRATHTFDKFRIGVTAGRADETDIERIVQAQGYRIARGANGAIGAVGALRFAYALGPNALGRAVRILGGAYDGDRAAFASDLIKGMALVCERYNGQLDDAAAVTRLAGLTGGPMAIERKAAQLRLKTGHQKPHCAAGALVEILNAGRGGQKLPSWWS